MPQEQEAKNREARPPREGQGQGRGPREGGGGPRRDDRPRGDDRRGGGDRGRFEGPPEIELEKLISDSLYLDNQAHGVVSRMRDMDSGTKSQLRRLYNAVRRAAGCARCSSKAPAWPFRPSWFISPGAADRRCGSTRATARTTKSAFCSDATPAAWTAWWGTCWIARTPARRAWPLTTRRSI